MNRLKVAIQDLRDHLGRDSQGIALLEKVATVANDQRKRAASLEETGAGLEATVKLLRVKLDSLEKEIAEAKAALSRESARLSASEARERALQAQRHPKEEPEEGGIEKSQFMDLLKRVRRRFKVHPMRAYGKVGDLVVEDIVKAFSYDEFAGLGMVCALCAMANLPVSLRSERPLAVGKELDDTQINSFWKWVRSTVYVSEAEKRIHAESTPVTSTIGSGQLMHWLH